MSFRVFQEKTTANHLSLDIMKSLICKIKGHHFNSNKKITLFIKEFECKNCKQKFIIDAYGNIIKLTSYWKDYNTFFENYYLKNSL